MVDGQVAGGIGIGGSTDDRACAKPVSTRCSRNNGARLKRARGRPYLSPCTMRPAPAMCVMRCLGQKHHGSCPMQDTSNKMTKGRRAGRPLATRGCQTNTGDTDNPGNSWTDNPGNSSGNNGCRLGHSTVRIAGPCQECYRPTHPSLDCRPTCLSPTKDICSGTPVN